MVSHSESETGNVDIQLVAFYSRCSINSAASGAAKFVSREAQCPPSIFGRFQ